MTGIMTNAHCVAEATFVQVEVQGMPDKVEAEVVAVSHQIDLALIRLADRALEAKLQKALPRIKLGDDLPAYRDKVVTVGYPQGGQQISFTEGVVSRIDVMQMAHSGLPSLLVQTDAAINPGNSGGPVFADGSGRAIGVATQKISGGEGLGYVVPVPMIRQFLRDLADQRVDGIPNLGFTYQTLENEALRRRLGLREGETGIRVNEIARGSSADGLLRPDDVILEIAGDPVYNDGRIPFRRDQRIGLGVHVFPAASATACRSASPGARSGCVSNCRSSPTGSASSRPSRPGVSSRAGRFTAGSCFWSSSRATCGAGAARLRTGCPTR